MLSEIGVQLFIADAVLRGAGVVTEKSMLLLSESKHPPRLRSAAVVLLTFPVGPAPSKQLAAPYPTMSTAHNAHDPLNGVVEPESATLPLLFAIAIVPIASGAGNGLPTFAFESS